MDNTIIDDTFRTIVEKMPDLYADLVKLVSKIAAYIFREEDTGGLLQNIRICMCPAPFLSSCLSDRQILQVL